jgi:rSAM/selenodomain-associated transferase 2
LPAISVAVVIPTLNEEDNLRSLLPALAGPVDEIVVSDGGSTDGSAALVSEAGLGWVTGPAGRGSQLNRGARATHAEVLLFLHADTRLPTGAVDEIRSAVAAGRSGGGFLAAFDDRAPLMRLGSALVNLRTRLTRWPLGDQAQFVTRTAFEELGGYREWPILEDLDFIRRLNRHGRIAVIRRPVLTSARRFRQNGIGRTLANNWSIWALYLLGVHPERLAQRYRDVR